MASATQHGPKRLFRVLIAGGILACAWVTVDAITHCEPAAAASSIDLIPDVGSTTTLITDIVTPVTTAVTPVVTPVVTTVTAPVKPVVTQVVNPVVTTVVAPITTPVVGAVVTPIAPIVTEVTAPVGQIVTAATKPLHPVLTPVSSTVGSITGPLIGSLETNVLQPLTPSVTALTTPLAPVTEGLQPVVGSVLQPLATVIEPFAVLDVAVELAQVTQTVPTMTPNGSILAAGGAVIVGAVLAALVTPLLPAPSNGGPLSDPLAPAAPTGSNGSSSVALYGELNSGVPAGTGAFGTGGADVDDLPSSPTFASDTTPD